MAVSTFLERFNYSKQQHTVSLFLSVNQVAIGFEKEGKTQVASCPVSSDPWLAARELLDKLEFRKMTLNIVLGHGLYQSFLIDDPNLSEQDKCYALPFHIRDLISCSPSDIVADGYRLPIADRYQVFVTQKAPLLQFSNELKKRRCRISCVSVENVVLRQWTRLDKNKMVLSKDGQGVVQLSVFCKGKLCFLRQIRGMTLDEAILQPSIVDELVLEIQRSIDYLKTQLKGIEIGGLVVSLQGVENDELVHQLLQRLPIPVRSQTMFEHGDHFQHIALAALDPDFSPYVNLLVCGETLTKKPLMRFSNVLLSWFFMVLLLGAGIVYQQYLILQTEENLAYSAEQLAQVQAKTVQLDALLALHLPSMSLIKEVERLKETLASKRSALKAVFQHDEALQQGYVSTFYAFTRLSRKDISVSDIFVSLDKLNLKGLSANPEAVPSWLSSFQTQPELSNRRFGSMELTRNEKNQLEFNLMAEAKKTEILQ